MEDGSERVLERLKAEGTIDASGVHFGPEELARILEAAPEDPERPGRRLFENARFDGAVFEGAASFAGVTFRGPATFIGVTFGGAASFVGVTFQRAAEFVGVTFEGEVSFFDARFQRGAWFRKVVFERQAVFRDASFEDDASFVEVTFKSDAWFDGTNFLGKASFLGTTFDEARDFGPVVVHRALDLEETLFAQPIRIEASARALSCRRAQFRGGADLLVRWAEVALDEADFAEPSMLSPRRQPVRGEEELRAGNDREGEATPRVISLPRAKRANLTIAGADLRAFRFESTLGLDELRLERVRFAEPPSGWQRTGRWPLPIRWTRRKTIAEEHQWRAETAGATGWYGPEVRATPGYWEDESHDALLRKAAEQTEQALQAELVDEKGAAEARALLRELIGERSEADDNAVPSLGRPEQSSGLESAPLPPQQIAAIYRALRKGQEDSKDEPGAADFYYGEMEMRRQQADGQGARAPPRGERLILWLYWLVSGYGLRASRALIALAVTVVVFAFLFDWWGFRPDQGFGRALLFSIESTSSLFRVPATEGFAFTAGGEVLQIILRLLGPLFFGLALLSLRGRVKR
jgi:uncharacterized protein YjbI with pentapeptide repeats